MIEFKGLSKRFGEKRVLDGIDLAIGAGTIHYVIGSSGAGKSVLMKHVVGLIRADAGEVRFEGKDVAGYSEAEFYSVRERVGFVFQHATLFDSLTALENVALAVRKRRGLSEAEATARAKVELERLHLGAWADRRPGELGAGLKKRVAVARALVLEPACVIYDEPTTYLDPVAARRMDELFRTLRARGVTQVVVSHDLASILGVADRISMLYRGKIHADGTPAELSASQDPVLQQFLTGAESGPI